MKTLLGWAVVALLSLGSIVVIAGPSLVEAATPRTNAIPHLSPERFANLIVDPRAECTYDFPALTDARVQLATVCAESWTCTATGATIGDTCLASSNLGADGGSALASTAQLRCRAVTNGVVFQLCNFTTDGGSYDLGDAGFVGRIIH